MALHFGLGGLVSADDFTRANVTSAPGVNIGHPDVGPVQTVNWADPYGSSTPSSGGIVSNRLVGPATGNARIFYLNSGSIYNYTSGVNYLHIDGATIDANGKYSVYFHKPGGNTGYSAVWDNFTNVLRILKDDATQLGSSVSYTFTAGHDYELRGIYSTDSPTSPTVVTMHGELWDLGVGGANAASPALVAQTTPTTDSTSNYLTGALGVGCAIIQHGAPATTGQAKYFATYNSDIQAGTSSSGTVLANSTPQTVTVNAPNTGSGAANWTTTAPVFQVINPSGGVVSGVTQTVTSAGIATVTFNPGATSGTYLVQDQTTTLQWPIVVGGGTSATGISLTGPSTGIALRASTPFTVALTPNGNSSTGATVTPSDGGAGGTFTPTTVALSTGTPSATFTYTPAARPGASALSVNINASTGAGQQPASATSSTIVFSATPQSPLAPTVTYPAAALNVTSTGDTIASVTASAPTSIGSDTPNYQFSVDTQPSMATAVTGSVQTSNVLNMTGLTNGQVNYVSCKVIDSLTGQYTTYPVIPVVSAKPINAVGIGDSEYGGSGILTNAAEAFNTALTAGNLWTMQRLIGPLTGGQYAASISNQAVGGTTTTNWLPTSTYQPNGTTGSTSTNLLNSAIAAAAAMSPPATIYTVQMGTNDPNAASFQADMTAIYNALIAAGATKIIQHYIAYKPVGGGSFNAQILLMNAILDTLVTSYASSNPGIVVAGDKTYYTVCARHYQTLCADGTHMTPLGAEEWGMLQAKAFVSNVLGIGASSGGSGGGTQATAAVPPLWTRAQATALIVNGLDLYWKGVTYTTANVGSLPAEFV